jgi:isopenicillin N synthase-like dioxygenase
VSGLVAQRLDGQWVSVPPLPGGIVVNVGEMLQRWSNDILRATPHQVLDDKNDPLVDNCEEDEAGVVVERPAIVPERYSIAFFCNANKETTLECLPVCHGPERPPRYEAINAFEYITMRLRSTIPVMHPASS